MDKQIEIGDLVKSAVHVGIGIIIDIIYPEQVNNPISGQKLLDEPTAEIYWTFPEPMVGPGWQNGNDYDYLSQLTVITEENKH